MLLHIGHHNELCYLRFLCHKFTYFLNSFFIIKCCGLPFISPDIFNIYMKRRLHLVFRGIMLVQFPTACRLQHWFFTLLFQTCVKTWEIGRNNVHDNNHHCSNVHLTPLFYLGAWWMRHTYTVIRGRPLMIWGAEEIERKKKFRRPFSRKKNLEGPSPGKNKL